MKIFFVATFAISLTSLSDCEKADDSSTVDFNKFYSKLLKHAKIGIKTYLEVPDADVLINSDSSKNFPCKLLNQSVQDTLLFDSWNEKQLAKHVNSSFVFADMTEVINKNPVQTRTSLRRFLNQLDQYTNEININFEMPTFFKFRFYFI
jgi:hypothetical protein